MAACGNICAATPCPLPASPPVCPIDDSLPYPRPRQTCLVPPSPAAFARLRPRHRQTTKPPNIANPDDMQPPPGCSQRVQARPEYRRRRPTRQCQRERGVFRYIAFSSFSFIVQVQVQGLAWMRLEKKHDHRSLLTPSHSHPGHPKPPRARAWVLPFFSLPRLCRLRHPILLSRQRLFWSCVAHWIAKWRPGVVLPSMCRPGQNVRSSVPWQPKTP